MKALLLEKERLEGIINELKRLLEELEASRRKLEELRMPGGRSRMRPEEDSRMRRQDWRRNWRDFEARSARNRATSRRCKRWLDKPGSSWPRSSLSWKEREEKRLKRANDLKIRTHICGSRIEEQSNKLRELEGQRQHLESEIKKTRGRAEQED
jgi:predicted  nucleic acid-binding Zn-ribbon protein